MASSRLVVIPSARRAALAAVVAALASVMAACSSRSHAASASSPATTPSAGGVLYRDRQFGWTIRYPRHLRVGRFTADGAWVANFDFGATGDETAEARVPDLRRLRAFPPSGVALMIWFGEGLPAPPPLHDTRFPVTTAMLHRIHRYVGGNEPAPRYGELDGDGTSFSVAVWFGPHASSAGRRAIETTLESLRFPRLRAGTTRANQFYVLRPAQSYPIGSVTHVAASTLPVRRPYFTTRHGFFLVHAPRAFYAIPDRFDYPDSERTCTLDYDPSSQRFTCPGTPLEWDRAGTPTAGTGSTPARASDWALGLHIATVAQDGHVLYSPFFGPLLGLRLKGNPWT